MALIAPVQTWLHLAKLRKPSKFELIAGSGQIVEVGGGSRFVLAAFTFETSGHGLPAAHTGFLNIVPGPGGSDSWRVWGLQTLLENYIGHEMEDLRKVYPDPLRDEFPETDIGLALNRAYRGYGQNSSIRSSTNGQKSSLAGLTNGHSSKVPVQTALNTLEKDAGDVDLIIIGGGQAGLSTAAYSKALGLRPLIIERYKEIGDNWTERYASLYLHTTHRWNDLPFGPTFNSKEYSEWLTSAEMKKGYNYFVKRYDIDVMLSSRVVSSNFDHNTRQWTVTVNHSGEEKIFTGAHLVLCTGSGGTIPMKPKWPGEEHFNGTVMHSIDWKSGAPFKGKKGVVVGTANTGHDMAEGMLAAGLTPVTMIQRGSTFVIERDWMTDFLNMAFPPNSVRSVDMSDRLFWAAPLGTSRHMCANFFGACADSAKANMDGLEKVGFKLDRCGDFMDNLIVRNGGHFMDHGASEKIRQGLIKMKSDSSPVAYTPTGIDFADGSHLEADVVVFATGFEKDIGHSAAPIVGKEVASQLDEFWGVDEEGEQRGLAKPCGFPNLWMMGGGCGACRYFPRFIALQILADRLGSPVKPFKETILSAAV